MQVTFKEQHTETEVEDESDEHRSSLRLPRKSVIKRPAASSKGTSKSSKK